MVSFPGTACGQINHPHFNGLRRVLKWLVESLGAGDPHLSAMVCRELLLRYSREAHILLALRPSRRPEWTGSTVHHTKEPLLVGLSSGKNDREKEVHAP
jgi:hypothetical protein